MSGQNGGGAQPVDFGAIAQLALSQCPDLLRRWFPRGRQQGKEFQVGNLGGEPGESLKVNTETGAWQDFATGDYGKDLIGLNGARLGVRQIEAAKRLAEELGQPVDEAPEKPEGSSGCRREVAAYSYTDAAGHLLYQVVRFKPKDFRQRRPDGTGGWVWSMKGVERVLYRLPQVLGAVRDGHTIYMAEGEKGVDALTRLGVVATCSPGGANKWRAEYGHPLANADVVLLPYNDPPGREHAASVAKALQGIASRVRVLELPELPPKGDLADWIAAGGTAARLEELTAKAADMGVSVAGDSGEPPTGDAEDPAEALNLAERVKAACKTNKGFRRLWRGDWTGLKDQSRSGKAFALMGALRRAGFDLDDAKAAVRLHRDTAAWAAEKGNVAGGREFAQIWSALAEGEAKRETARAELGDFDANEDGIALAFAKRHAADLRYDHDAGAWYR